LDSNDLMTDPQGTIVEIIRDERGIRAIVAVEAAAVCARCASGRGCGAGIFMARQGVRRLEVALAGGGPFAEGDVVSIELAPGNVLRAALLVYGLPLAGAAAGAALAFAFALGDAGAAATALAGLAVGAVAGRRRLRGDCCLARFTPTLSRHVETGR
jgi:sigma-E factor negative regulatory protein RseC